MEQYSRRDVLRLLPIASLALVLGCGGGGGGGTTPLTLISFTAKVDGSVLDNMIAVGVIFVGQQLSQGELITSVSYNGLRLSGALWFMVNQQLPEQPTDSVNTTHVNAGDKITWQQAT